MNNDLIDRYIYAVTRRLPHKARADIDAELRGLIEDMLEEKTGGLPPSHSDIHAVLAQLGTPGELAEKYSPNGQKALVGPPYFAVYKMVLGIVVACVVFGMAVSGVVQVLFGAPLSTGLFPVVSWLGSLFSGVVFAFAFVTAFFAFFQWRQIPLYTLPESLDSLPPVPKKQEKISTADCLASIAFSVVFMVLFLGAPALIRVYFSGGQTSLPVFNIALLQSKWVAVAAIGGIAICCEIFNLYEGRYTKTLAAVNIAANLLAGVFTLVLFGGANLLNPAFLAAFGAEISP
ncbi:MAG: HAAS signaling domain-containing protein, partial [Oscillospiraceae bacterium]